jgi:hypothetical protein
MGLLGVGIGIAIGIGCFHGPFDTDADSHPDAECCPTLDHAVKTEKSNMLDFRVTRLWKMDYMKITVQPCGGLRGKKLFGDQP